ncbi:EKC/KEOPS complex subunit TP53RK [Onthophagus taurus]|uniref:EKC/KEOPS complex subunit TP53RK n=1 Tax=Onthophagus taurus TaxID=166361 RepID=UPI0039BE2E65
MEGFKLIKQGAESKLYKGTYLGKPTLIKERFEKKYRHPDLDNLLTKERIKAECRIALKCKNIGVRTPMIYLADMTRRMIFMEFIEHSLTAKEFISIADNASIDELSKDIGKVLAKLHSGNVIHGDLTTSNILLRNKNSIDNFEKYDDLELVMIDFGLSRTDSSTEDKGVDLYVLERALLSTHSVHERMFNVILKEYEGNYENGYHEIYSKYKEVKSRGRKRTMVG